MENGKGETDRRHTIGKCRDVILFDNNRRVVPHAPTVAFVINESNQVVFQKKIYILREVLAGAVA